MELKVTHDQILAAMVADGIPAETAGPMIVAGLEAASGGMAAFFAATDRAPPDEWPNTYLIGLQFFGALTAHYLKVFKQRTEALGLPEGFVSFDPAPPDAAA